MVAVYISTASQFLRLTIYFMPVYIDFEHLFQYIWILTADADADEHATTHVGAHPRPLDRLMPFLALYAILHHYSIDMYASPSTAVKPLEYQDK